MDQTGRSSIAGIVAIRRASASRCGRRRRPSRPPARPGTRRSPEAGDRRPSRARVSGWSAGGSPCASVPRHAQHHPARRWRQELDDVLPAVTRRGLDVEIHILRHRLTLRAMRDVVTSPQFDPQLGRVEWKRMRGIRRLRAMRTRTSSIMPSAQRDGPVESPRDRWMVVPPAALRAVRPHRLLRHVALAARDRACGELGTSGRPIVRADEDWFFDYASNQFAVGPPLAEPTHHPIEQPVPGPDGRVPPNWEQLLNE